MNQSDERVEFQKRMKYMMWLGKMGLCESNNIIWSITAWHVNSPRAYKQIYRIDLLDNYGPID